MKKTNIVLIVLFVIVVIGLVAALIYIGLNNNNGADIKANKSITETSNYSEKDVRIQELERNLKEKDDSIKKLEKDIFVLEGDIAKLKEAKTSENNNENEYELVKRLALEALKGHAIYFGDDTSNYIKAKEVYISDIEICNKEYLETMVNNNVMGNYPFQLEDLKQNSSDIVGGITYTLVFDKDVTNGWFVGSGPDYTYKNYAIGSIGFTVKKINGEYKISFGNC